VKANPKHAGAWHNMGIVYRDMGRQDLAVDALEKAVTLNPMLLR
jgi:cytochrome c-type biogenesis protein CcmH/NrfG